MNPQPIELKKALEHIFYEMMQLFGCVRLLENRSANTTSERLISNSLMESMLMHARALQTFFEASSPHCDDVISLDYEFSPIANVYPQNTRMRINKEIVHITFHRNSQVTKDWNLADLRNPMQSACTKFILHIEDKWDIDTDRDITKFARDRLQDLRKELQNPSTRGLHVSSH